MTSESAVTKFLIKSRFDRPVIFDLFHGRQNRSPEDKVNYYDDHSHLEHVLLPCDLWYLLVYS